MYILNSSRFKQESKSKYKNDDKEDIPYCSPPNTETYVPCSSQKNYPWLLITDRAMCI